MRNWLKNHCSYFRGWHYWVKGEKIRKSQEKRLRLKKLRSHKPGDISQEYNTIKIKLSCIILFDFSTYFYHYFIHISLEFRSNKVNSDTDRKYHQVLIVLTIKFWAIFISIMIINYYLFELLKNSIVWYIYSILEQIYFVKIYNKFFTQSCFNILISLNFIKTSF